MIRFSVARLEKEPIELVGSEPAEFLEIEPSSLLTVAAPVSYDLLVKSVSGGALVRGSCGTVVAGKCGRCLAAVEQPVEARDIAFFVEIPDGMEICDISEDIREELSGRRSGQVDRVLVVLGSLLSHQVDVEVLEQLVTSELEETLHGITVEGRLPSAVQTVTIPTLLRNLLQTVHDRR